jgi:Xaa-Pro aminopeptidase
MDRAFQRRLAAVERAVAEVAGADAFLITNPANILYLSGFAGTAGRALLARGRLYFITDFRYSRTVQALSSAWPDGSQVIEIQGSYDAAMARAAAAAGARRVGFEAGHVTVAQHRAWTAAMTGVELVPAEGIVERLRVVKDAGELETMREAGRRVSAVAARLREWAREGRREREVAADVNYALAAAGFSRPAFETIVASGPNAALPHARPGDRELTAGDLVVVDFGGVLDGYAVDITRTVSIGPAASQLRDLHAAVLEAHSAAASRVMPGTPVQDVDLAAREALERRGYGAAIRHATGHGLGLDVHEAPRLSKDAPADTPVLAAGMVVTIEPGAYLDDPAARTGSTGVRIEDDLVVTNDGPEWLTHAPRDL